MEVNYAYVFTFWSSFLVRYVSQDITDFLEKLTDSELKEEISLTMDDEIYEELVDNITSDDERELTTKEQIDYIISNLTEETFIDINNTGGKY